MNGTITQSTFDAVVMWKLYFSRANDNIAFTKDKKLQIAVVDAHWEVSFGLLY